MNLLLCALMAIVLAMSLYAQDATVLGITAVLCMLWYRLHRLEQNVGYDAWLCELANNKARLRTLLHPGTHLRPINPQSSQSTVVIDWQTEQFCYRNV